MKSQNILEIIVRAVEDRARVIAREEFKALEAAATKEVGPIMRIASRHEGEFPPIEPPKGEVGVTCQDCGHGILDLWLDHKGDWDEFNEWHENLPMGNHSITCDMDEDCNCED